MTIDLHPPPRHYRPARTEGEVSRRSAGGQLQWQRQNGTGRRQSFSVGPPPPAPTSSNLGTVCSLAVAASAVVVLGLRIGHVLTGDTPLIVAIALVVLGGALDVYAYFLQAKVREAMLPDYEAGKTARERSERLRLLAREIVGRTTTGVWDGWEEEEWDQLTAGMDKASVERLVLDACWDEEIREKYLTITTRPLGLPDAVDPRGPKAK